MLIFSRVSRTDAECIYTIVQNTNGAAVSSGVAMVWGGGGGGASFDGIIVAAPATATLSLLAGITGEAMADSAYGKLQIYGANTQAYITNTTNTAIALGDILKPVNAVTYLTRAGASDGTTGFVIAGEAVATATTPAQAVHKVFIRCM
jgi:hypothetical protein